MRQCRFCGHINGANDVYCISCDSPLDATTESMVPEELQGAIDNNQKGSPTINRGKGLHRPEPSVHAIELNEVDYDALSSQIVDASLAAHSPFSDASNPDPYNPYAVPGPSVEDIPSDLPTQAISPSAFPQGDDTVAVADDLSTSIEPHPPVPESEPHLHDFQELPTAPPEASGFGASSFQPPPSYVESAPQSPVPSSADPAAAISTAPLMDSVPVSSSDAYFTAPDVNSVPPAEIPVEPTQALPGDIPVEPTQALPAGMVPPPPPSSPHVGLPIQNGPPLPGAGFAETKALSSGAPGQIPQQPPEMPQTPVPSTGWEQGSGLEGNSYSTSWDEKDDFGGDKAKEAALGGGWRVLSTGLLILLMVLSGAFLAVMLYMSFFSEDDEMGRRKKVRVVTKKKIRRPRPVKRIKKVNPLRKIYRYGLRETKRGNWKEAQKQFKLVATKAKHKKLKKLAEQWHYYVTIEQKAHANLASAQKLYGEKKWAASLALLVQIPKRSKARPKADPLLKSLHKNYVKKQLKRAKRQVRRRRYRRAFFYISPVLLANYKHKPTLRFYQTLSYKMKYKQTRCSRRCRRRYWRRRHRRRKKRCQRRCNYKFPTSYVQDIAKKNEAKKKAQQVAVASAIASGGGKAKSDATPQPKKSKCQSRCDRRYLTRWERCKKKRLRRYRYWCRYHCRRRYRSRRYRSRKKRCYQKCNRREYKRMIRRKCRRSRYRYKRCQRRCRS